MGKAKLARSCLAVAITNSQLMWSCAQCSAREMKVKAFFDRVALTNVCTSGLGLHFLQLLPRPGRNGLEAAACPTGYPRPVLPWTLLTSQVKEHTTGDAEVDSSTQLVGETEGSRDKRPTRRRRSPSKDNLRGLGHCRQTSI